MPKILDYEKFCEDLEEVTSLKTIGKRKFHPEGLFSEQIFGPVKNYTCQCGTYYGVSRSGGQCDICEVDITNSDVRRTKFAKITLPMKVVNPLFYDLLVDLGGKSFKSALDDLMKQEKSVLYMDEGEHVVIVNPEILSPEIETWEKTDAIEKLVTDVATTMAEDGIAEWKLIKDNINNLFLSKIIVLPPDLRPTSKSTGNRQLMDKINRYYVQILTKKEIMRETTIDIRSDKNMYYTYFKQLQGVVDELYDQILAKMAKKEGLIRGNILGKRIDFSGRAVISPDPTLNLNECVLPYLMILEMFKLPIARRIIQLGKFKLLNKAIDFVDRCIATNSPVLFKVCEEIVKDEVCILNRQPSLHRLGMLGFNIKISLDQVIKIHPLVCHPFNADFDGDQMAVYIPVTEEAKQEVIDKMFVTKNLNSPANETLTTIPNQDIVLGIYFLTSDKFSNVDGHKLFNDCLPDDYVNITGVVDQKKLLEILNHIKDTYSYEQTQKVLDDVKRIGFKYSTLYGCTLSLEDFNDQPFRESRDAIYAKPTVREQLVGVSSDEITNELREKFAYSYMIDSGARGSWDQVKQLILTRGFVANFDGEILPLPIKHNLVEGLSQEEFFYSTFGCRKGLLDIALNTGTSGYLSRKLIFTCANLQIDLELVDCGTTDTLTVNVKDKRKAAMLVNRYCLSEDGKSLYKITKENCKDIIGKQIEIRSPILCKSPKICQTCYGDLHKSINSRFVGIIAAQTLGERATQLVLRTFHTSGSAIIKGAEDNVQDSMKQKDIIGDLATVASLLHKFKNKDYIDIVDQLFQAYDADIYHVHYECVVAQLMWKDFKKWRLLKNREKVKPNYYSVQSVPNQESWILAMAFSNPKRSILHGILYEGRYSGVMDKILKGERIT
jgi:DNA-directed RNA polymerase subunit beta'